LAIFDQIGNTDSAIGKPFPRLSSDPAQYFRMWISTPVIADQTEGTPDPSYFDLEVGYWSERRRANLLMVHYSDLLYDLGAEMRRIASFLDIHVHETIWPRLIQAASFQAMQAAGEALMPQARKLFPEGAARFFYKGENGRWRGILTDDDLATYDTKVRTKFPSGLASWLEGGRRMTGEPHTIAR
jgi:aryl sulfotransferase